MKNDNMMKELADKLNICKSAIEGITNDKDTIFHVVFPNFRYINT